MQKNLQPAWDEVWCGRMGGLVPGVTGWGSGRNGGTEGKRTLRYYLMISSPALVPTLGVGLFSGVRYLLCVVRCFRRCYRLAVVGLE